jgi:hypothetical protein
MDLVDWAGNSGHAAGSAVQCCATKPCSTKGKGVYAAELGLKGFWRGELRLGWLQNWPDGLPSLPPSGRPEPTMACWDLPAF